MDESSDLGIYLRVFLIHQNIPIASLSISHINNNLIRILQRSGLNPRLDLLLCGKGQHVLNFLRRTNGTAANLDTIAYESESVDLRELTTVRGPERNRLVRVVLL